MTMKLLTPVTLGDLQLKNRVALAPMTRSRAGVERIPNKLMVEYYAQRATAGLIITEATVVSTRGIGWQQSPGIYNNEQVAGWRPVVESVHAKGGHIFMQLWHCGRASHSSFPERKGELPDAPSALKLNGDHIHTPAGKMEYEVPHALTIDEIGQTINDYRSAAQRARDAGFDGIEIHAANGYLIDQFLQSKTNVRSDCYGGSIENRCRFLMEILQACLEIWPAQRIGVRFAPNGAFNDMGSADYRETFLYAAKAVNDLNIGYIHVMDGLAFGFHELGEPMTLKEFRAVYSGTLIGNCGYTKATAEDATTSGLADMIAFGRPYIANPDLVERFAHDWPLAKDMGMKSWYSFDEKGYADYPPYAG